MGCNLAAFKEKSKVESKTVLTTSACIKVFLEFYVQLVKVKTG